MSTPGGPPADTGSAEELTQELLLRARAWLPQWEFDEIAGDFGRALMVIAARMGARVQDGLALVPRKNQLGLLEWLGVGPFAPQAASMPVYFQLAPTATAVTAPQGTRLQASLAQPVIFETLDPLRIVPGTIAALVGADPAADRYFVPSAGLLGAGQPGVSQSQWTTLAAASYPPTLLQLSSANGLAVNQILVIAGQQFRITALQGSLVTLSAPGPRSADAGAAPASLPSGSVVTLLNVFAPFGASALGTQEHSLLLGDDALLNLPGPATVDVLYAGDAIPANVLWSYWGTSASVTTPGWQTLTAEESTPGIVTLTKEPGATVSTKVGVTAARWLRGTLPGVSSATLDLSTIQLRVRSGTGAATGACPDPTKSPAAFLKYNAMWNNTPLVTGACFLPFGPMPRLLDAFYVGCAEAFGKAGALVSLCVAAATPTPRVLAAWSEAAMMFGVGEDGRLQRLELDSHAGTAKFLRATQPRVRDAAPGPATNNPIALEMLPTAAPLLRWSSGHTAAVLVSSRHRVWMWTEPRGGTGFWTALGEAPARIEGLVALRLSTGVRVVVLTEGRLQYFDLQPERPSFSVQWHELPAQSPEEKDVQAIRTIAAVRTATEDVSDALVAVTAAGRLRHYSSGNWHTVATFAEPVDPAFAPLAVGSGKQTAYVVKVQDRNTLAAWRSGSDAPPVHMHCIPASGFDVLRAPPGRGDALDFAVLMLTRTATDAPRVSWWRPFSAGEAPYLFWQHPPAGPRPLAGTPAVFASDLLVTAGFAAELFVSRLAPEAHFAVEASKSFSVALLSPGFTPDMRDALLSRTPPEKARAVSRVLDFRTLGDGTGVACLDGRLTRPDAVSGFRELTVVGESRVAWPETARSLNLEANGAEIHPRDTLMVGQLRREDEGVTERRLYDVIEVVTDTRGHVRVSLDRDLHLTENIRAAVVTMAGALPGSVRPAFRLSELPALPGHVGAETLLQGAFYATDSDPVRQDVALHLAAEPPLLVLAANWKRFSKQTLRFEALVQGSISVDAPVADSPQLQWQYWDGSSWSPIPGVDDETDELMQSGTVRFYVPPNLTPTAVAGKNDAWIRASLVAGNYGLESYTVNPSPPAAGASYKAVPDDSAVNPPKLKSIDISYRVCQAQAPAYVVTYDNGSYNDQSVANRAGGNAVVRAFVPLREALNPAPPAAAAGQSPDACECATPCGVGTAAAVAVAGGAPGVSTASPAAGPLLFVGLDQPIEPDSTISILWEVAQEEDFSALLPLEVTGVGPAGAKIPLNSGDHTRALGETQVLTVALSAPLIQVNLFGQSLYWLCLQPARAGGWSPQIAAAYLNGVFAAAQETQTLERLGSSIGEPAAQFSLLRTPVLHGTLELRVAENLAAADLAALLKGNPDAVLTNPDKLTGDWVLWQQVADTAAFGPTERVYTLDEVGGVITFGDGIHGLIPPVARGNIVAFRYRQGGGAAANAFQPGDSLSLVSPVRGVSAVLAPEAAAGGSDATPEDSLLRIAPAQISQRDRAITPRDLEQLALQSSPAIAQARTWHSGGRVRLVTLVTGTGSGVAPSRAQERALTGFLQSRMTPALAAVVSVVPPRLVPVRITIAGTVTSFDVAAQVGADVNDALAGLFDPQTGGIAGTGWPLGRAPMNDDVVAALNGVTNLTGIVAVTLESLDDQGNALALPTGFAVDQFPVLADAGVLFDVQAVAA